MFVYFMTDYTANRFWKTFVDQPKLRVEVCKLRAGYPTLTPPLLLVRRGEGEVGFTQCSNQPEVVCAHRTPAKNKN